MVTADQFIAALAEVESSNSWRAWGDAGQAMGRWQIHPARFWDESRHYGDAPNVTETWDAYVRRLVAARFLELTAQGMTPVRIAMFWHLGNFKQWDDSYAARFNAALAAMLGI